MYTVELLNMIGWNLNPLDPTYIDTFHIHNLSNSHNRQYPVQMQCVKFAL